MYLKRIADEISALVNDTTLGSTGTNYARTKMWIRDCYFNDILARANNWWFLRKVGFIQTVASITTGTVTVTKGSTTVTGSGTSWTTAVNGRLLIVNGRTARISAYVSATSLTLDYEWEADTSSGASYVIVKDKYALPRWLDPKRILNIKPNGYRALEGRSSQELDALYSNKAGYGTPTNFVVVDRQRTEYSTGTVTLTSSSKSVTGSSTAWTSTSPALEQFDKLTVGTNAYTINTIDSATAITLFENASTSESASTYVALMDRFYIELYPYPTELRVLAVLGTTLPPQLDDDSDVSMLPDEFYPLLVKGGYIRALKHNGDSGVTNEIAEFNSSLKRLMATNNRDDYRSESWWK